MSSLPSMSAYLATHHCVEDPNDSSSTNNLCHTINEVSTEVAKKPENTSSTWINGFLGRFHLIGHDGFALNLETHPKMKPVKVDIINQMKKSGGVETPTVSPTASPLPLERQRHNSSVDR